MVIILLFVVNIVFFLNRKNYNTGGVFLDGVCIGVEFSFFLAKFVLKDYL